MRTNKGAGDQRGFRLTGMIALLWFAAVAAAGYGGLVQDLPRMAFPFLVALTVMVPVALYFVLSDLRAYLRGLGLQAITAFHVWRIGAGFVFFAYGMAGLLPERFVAFAGWGDFLAGVFAGVAVLLPYRRGLYAAAHIFGFADLILAVSTGAVLLFLGVPEMANVAVFPVLLIPLFGVGISILAHIVAFDLMLSPTAASGRPELSVAG